MQWVLLYMLVGITIDQNIRVDGQIFRRDWFVDFLIVTLLWPLIFIAAGVLASRE